MGFRIINPGTKESTIPCNVCDGEYTKEAFEGTKTGICKDCRLKRSDADLAALYYILNTVHESMKKQERNFTWLHIREIVKTLYVMLEDKNFVNNVGTYLTRLGLLRNEILTCINAYVKLKQHGYDT